MIAPIGEEAEKLLADIAQRHEKYPILSQLGFPSGDAGEKALVLLHAGSAYHALAVILDVVLAYEQSHAPYSIDIGYKDILLAPVEGRVTRDIAETYYRSAIGYSPELAEAHFNLARLIWDRNELTEASRIYRKVVGMDSHPKAPPHAALKANAYWNLAEILDFEGRESEALEAYGDAVALLPSFGVHHVKYAQLLRKHGHIELAMEQFDRTMVYTHRYFPEFCLPPLSEPGAEDPHAEYLESLMRLRSGDHVVFWGGRYFAIPEESFPIRPDTLANCTAEEVCFTPYLGNSSDDSPGFLSGWFFKLSGKRATDGEGGVIRVSDVMTNLEKSP